MIFEFEKLTESDKILVDAFEPYIDFHYSFRKGMYYWQRHHYIIGGKDIYKLRLHKGENIRQGLICTSFEEAEKLSMLLEGSDEGASLKEKYLWLEGFLAEQKENTFLDKIALPVSEYIKRYANNFEMLKLLDFEAIFSFQDK